MYILDSSVFIRGHIKEGDTATVPGVSSELVGDSKLRFEVMRGEGMKIQIPQEKTIKQVSHVAERTGDSGVLSMTDVCLIAAAIELDGVLVKDDYAIQNTATELGLDIEGIVMDGIKQRRKWIFQCESCGKVSKTIQERCRVCGGAMSRKNPLR